VFVVRVRRRFAGLAWVLVVGGVLFGGVSGASAIPTTPCGGGITPTQSGSTATCSYASGASDTFTVPAGVTSVMITAVGGGGGSAEVPCNSPGPGGDGAIVSTTATVNPTDSLAVTVADNGANGTGNAAGCTTGNAPGGFGAGTGGSGGLGEGGGGGGSEVADAGTPLVVAGGGGGGGNGVAGGDAGQDGGNSGGLAGTQTGPGSAGGSGLLCQGSGPGTGMNGGDGAYNGGGGGGGYYGGGGGCDGGGGGGSSYPASDVTGYDSTGTPSVTISYSVEVPCSAGSYSTTGNTPCLAADAGNYVAAAGATGETRCAAGYYQPNTGQASCVAADAGNYVAAAGATGETRCAAGYYQPNAGQASCVAADAGNYVAAAGATGETKCAAGYYQPNAGQASCVAADAGNYVAAAGATGETKCAAGYYQPNTAQSACLPAALGYFVATTGQTNEVACPAGQTTLAFGATSCVVSVTPASVCALTLSDADGSAKYLALSPAQRTAFNKTITALCAADLTPITPSISSSKKALLISLYKLGVSVLASTGWLTHTQATQLATLAGQL
jgi:hypothetical protein